MTTKAAPAPSAAALGNLEPSGSSTRILAFAIGVTAAFATLVIVAFGRVQLPAFPQFTTMQTVWVFLVDGIAAFLLFGQLRHRHTPAHAALASTYLLTALLMPLFILTFPGAIQPGAVVLGNSQSAIWVWFSWHLLFPLGIGVSALLERYRFQPPSIDRHPWRIVALGVGSAVLLAALVTLLALHANTLLPLMVDNRTTPSTRLPPFFIAGGLTVLAGLGGVFLLWPACRRGSTLHIWLAVTLVVYLCEVAATLAAASRYSVAWYFGRLNGMVASSILLALFLHSANRTYMRLHESLLTITAEREKTREINRELVEVLDLNRKIIANSPLGIAAFRGDGTCILANQAAARLAGADVDKLIGTNFHMLNTWRDSGLYAAALAALETKLPQRVYAHFVSTYGKEMQVECDLLAFTSGGAPHLLLVMADVSAFRKTHQALLAAKKVAEDANRAKSNFLANMSHEIRTPMNAILGLVQLTLDTELTPTQREHLRQVQKSSRALLTILNDILDYSKIEADHLDLDQVEFSLNGLLESVSGLFALPAEEKGLELIFDVAPDLPAMLVGDPLRLGQILNNLVGNAIKFTRHGQVVVSVSREPSGDGSLHLLFRIRDSGIGLSAEQTKRLFQPFTQADGSITRHFGGTGLGLSISKRLVELMGGHIGVDGAPGLGCEFHFTVRLREAKSDGQPVPPLNLENQRILVADDHPQCLAALQRTLAAHGAEVVAVPDGEQAIAQLRRTAVTGQPFSICLLDCQMPAPAGPEAAFAIRSLCNTLGLPVPLLIVMATPHGRTEAMAALGEPPMAGMLAKPVTPLWLLSTIAQQMNAGTMPPAAIGLPSTPVRRRSDAAGLHGARVLLVEDDQINRVVASEFLRRAGVSVDAVASGFEALVKLDEQSYDAALIDLQMPGMDGFETARRIRLKEAGKALPLIAFTASALSDDRQAALDAGMDDHLPKPFEPEQLLGTLRRWIKPRSGSPPPTTEAAPLAEPISLPGFDLAQAVARGGIEWRMVPRLLDAFVHQFSPLIDTLDRLIAEERYLEASKLVHSVRGAAATLGAVELQEAAGPLEAGLRAGDSAALPRFRSCLAAALAAIGEQQRTTAKSTAEVH